MKLTPYVLSKIEEEIKEELFSIWLRTEVTEWAALEDNSLLFLHADYHNLFKDRIEEV